MKVLITGGAGFLGSFIARYFDSPVILDLKKGEQGIFEFGSITAWSDIAEVFKNTRLRVSSMPLQNFPSKLKKAIWMLSEPMLRERSIYSKHAEFLM